MSKPDVGSEQVLPDTAAAAASLPYSSDQILLVPQRRRVQTKANHNSEQLWMKLKNLTYPFWEKKDIVNILDLQIKAPHTYLKKLSGIIVSMANDGSRGLTSWQCCSSTDDTGDSLSLRLDGPRVRSCALSCSGTGSRAGQKTKEIE